MRPGRIHMYTQIPPTIFSSIDGSRNFADLADCCGHPYSSSVVRNHHQDIGRVFLPQAVSLFFIFLSISIYMYSYPSWLDDVWVGQLFGACSFAIVISF